MYKIQSHIKPPTMRRTDGMKPAEKALFDAYITAYDKAHGCKLVLSYFDRESRIATLKGPAFTVAATARRAKELTKQLRFRKA